MRNFAGHFSRTSHFRTTKFRSLQNFAGHFHRGQAIFAGHFTRVEKILQPSCLHCLSPPPISHTCELVRRRFPTLLICVIQVSKRKMEENQAASKPAPKLENLCIGLLHFSSFSLRFLASPPKPFAFGPFIHK